jgi:hypothetical protein
MSSPFTVTWEQVAGHGADDYESDAGQAWTGHASHGNETAATVNVNVLDDGTVRIRWIETHIPRTGAASALLDALADRFAGSWETGGFTDDGAALFDAYAKRTGRHCVQQPDTYLDDDPDV